MHIALRLSDFAVIVPTHPYLLAFVGLTIGAYRIDTRADQLTTRDAYRARRKLIAAEMATISLKRRPGAVDEVAYKYNCSRGTVYSACRQYRVAIPRAKL